MPVVHVFKLKLVLNWKLAKWSAALIEHIKFMGAPFFVENERLGKENGGPLESPSGS